MVIGQRLLTSLAWLLVSLAFVKPCLAGDISLEAQSQGLAHFIMALCYDDNAQGALAISEYQKSIQFNGQATLPRLKLGDYYFRLGEIDKALDQIKTVVRLNPHNQQALYQLALIYSSQQKYDAAASAYELLLKDVSKVDPANEDVYLYLGQLYYAQSKYPKAIEQFSKLIKLEPKNIAVLFLLGSVYADSNDNRKAMEVFQRVLQLDPNNSDGLNSLGYIYAQEGVHLDEAITMIRKALDVDPTSGAYYDSLGWALYKKGMYAASLEALKKAQTYIEDEILYDHLGQVYKALKAYPLALKNWQESLKLDPHQIIVQQKIDQLKKCIASQSIHQQN